MIANNMMPSEPVHPGLLLKEEIEYRGVTQKQLAQQMGVSYSVLNEILNGKRPVSIEYALYLEAVLGIDAQLWIQMQADYNLQVAKRERSIVISLKSGKLLRRFKATSKSIVCAYFFAVKEKSCIFAARLKTRNFIL